MPAATPKPADPRVKDDEPVNGEETAKEAKPRTSLWEALTNLSIGRAFSKESDKAADIVHKGETVELTEDQAHGFLHRHKKPVIRPAKDSSEPDPKLTARDLFGTQPRAEQFGARPDPAGSSKVIESGADPEHAQKAPEGNDPQVDFSIDPDAARDK